MAGLRREILKWLQSLDLTFPVRNPKWDLTNGYVFAEIFSWYYPQDVEMHMFYNGASLDTKSKNWLLLCNFIKRFKMEISNELIEGTIHCKEGAAILLMEKIFEILTNRRVQKLTLDHEVDFTDHAYQVQLPMHARSTANKAVKNNIKGTELAARPDLTTCQFKTQIILDHHIDHRHQERIEAPERFGIRPKLGELARRRTPPPEDTEAKQSTNENKRSHSSNAQEIDSAKDTELQATSPVREILVQQPLRSTSLKLSS